MPGQPMKHLSLAVIADFENDDHLWESILNDVMLGKTWRKVLIKRLHEDRMVTWGVMLDWIDRSPERVKILKSAERYASGMDIDDTITIADDLSEDPASRKVRIEARWKKASKVDRDNWGEKVVVASSVNVSIDAGLISTASQLLAERVRSANARAAIIDVTPQPSTRAIDVSREPDGQPSSLPDSVFAVESPHPIPRESAPMEAL